MMGKVHERREPGQLPALHLAYVGDAVYELAVREELLGSGFPRSEDLHKATVGWVQASAQAAAAHFIAPLLTAEEHEIFMRGRNVKPARIPKKASVSEYCYSTALEAVFGYLYLAGRNERLSELLREIFAARPHQS